MIYVILAAGLGANFIVFALLFRRLRQLSWQLRDMRAERNSEWILHALQGAPEEHMYAVPAADGTGLEPPPDVQPVRRKRHLGLYIGGLSGIAATVTETIRYAWREHRGQVIASLAAVTIAAATTVVLLVVERQAVSEKRSPSSAPTVTSTVTQTATATAAPEADSPSTTNGPPSSTSPATRPSASALPTAAGGVSGAPIDSQPPAPSGTAPSGSSTEPSPTGSGTPAPSSSAPPPEQPSPSPALCLGLVVMPVLDLTACLLGGG